MTALTVIVGACCAYLTAYVAYDLLLFIANAVIADPPEFVPARERRFNVLVPAHNEELFLPRLLKSLADQRYSRDCCRVTVIADNCTDGTAGAASQFGVDVLNRNDVTRRGKGYAIGWALERIDTTAFDALAIVDSDSIVDPDFLRQLTLQLERGDVVVQCYNGVANPGQSWFTRLMDVSRTIGNDILHPAKRKLGLSSFLMGNGMCFDVNVIRSSGWNAFTVGEDWEYYARLLLSGVNVGYCRQARVYHQESTNLQQASSQRMRWASSRFQILRRYGLPLIVEGIRSRRLTCIDASLPLVFPNTSLGINLTLVVSLAAAILWWVGQGAGLFAWAAALAASQLVMFAIGVLHTEDWAANARSLALAPVFLVWKMGIDILSVFGVGTRKWNPTRRRS